MPEKNIVEDVIGDFVDNFTESVQKKKNVSFFEQEDTVASRFSRLFGREKPIHHVLGGGKCKNFKHVHICENRDWFVCVSF